MVALNPCVAPDFGCVLGLSDCSSFLHVFCGNWEFLLLWMSQLIQPGLGVLWGRNLREGEWEEGSAGVS